MNNSVPSMFVLIPYILSMNIWHPSSYNRYGSDRTFLMDDYVSNCLLYLLLGEVNLGASWRFSILELLLYA